MAICPECDATIDVDEFDVDRGDELSCPECGSNLVTSALAPVELVTLVKDGPQENMVENGSGFQTVSGVPSEDDSDWEE